MHLHEEKGWIRPLQPGDKSRVIKSNSFVMPDEELFVDDMMKVRDLGVPNSLATQNNIMRTTTTYSYKSKFFANQMVIFADPITGRDAFGRVISEWNETGSASAPAGYRGDGSKVFYIVEILGLVANAKKVSSLLRLCNPTIKKRENNCGKVEGSEDLDIRHSLLLARNIEKKIALQQAVQKLGPMNHLRYVTSLHEDDVSEIQSQYSNSSAEITHSPTRGNPKVTYHDGMDFNVYANRNTEIESQLSATNPNWRPFPANERTLEDYLDSTADLVRRPFVKRAMNVVLLGDHEMDELESYIKSIIERKNNLLSMLINGQMFKSKLMEMKRSFRMWQTFVNYMRDYESYLAATRIQSRARVWLCRVLLLDVQYRMSPIINFFFVSCRIKLLRR